MKNNDLEMKKNQNMVSESDKANLEKGLGAVIEALIAGTDTEQKSQELVNVITNIFDRELDKSVEKNITPDTLHSIVNLMANEINSGNYQTLKSVLKDPCNIAYFKLAQKNEKLKSKNVKVGALNAAVNGLTPLYLEQANAEFACLLETTLDKVRSDVRVSIHDNNVENIDDVLNDTLAKSYVEKYSDRVADKYSDLEALDDKEYDSLSAENEENYTSKADKFISKLDDSMRKVVCYYSSLFYEPTAFMASNGVDTYKMINDKVDAKFASLNISSLSLPQFVTLVKGNSLTPEELKAAQSWLSDTNVETYEAIADLALKRK